MTGKSISLEEVFRGRTGIDVDEVIVGAKDLQLARAQDEEAIARLRWAVSGLELYFHLIGIKNHEEIVTTRELCELGIIESVTVKVREP